MQLVLNGWLKKDYDGMPAIIYNGFIESIPRLIQNKTKYTDIDEEGLGEYYTNLPNCNMRIYYTDKECTQEEAECALVDKLEGGLEVDIALEGYSEYTITGYCLEKFTIGGHDLESEILNHIGEYCWIIMEYWY